jgi:hypothetical protein
MSKTPDGEDVELSGNFCYGCKLDCEVEHESDSDDFRSWVSSWSKCCGEEVGTCYNTETGEVSGQYEYEQPDPPDYD